MEMDYYDVLGIRPSAGPDEIELAYRGRRSQYHPDRYASSDAEALEWATAKMKEINEAYAALRDPVARAQADQRRQRQPGARDGGSTNPGERRQPANGMTLKDALRGLVLNGEPVERIFIAPQIPRKKLAGALESYGEDLEPKDVVVLIDDTLFGGAREGVLITENQIRCKAVFHSADIRLLGFLSSIIAEGKHIFINGDRYAELNMPNKGDLKALCKAVTTYLQRTI